MVVLMTYSRSRALLEDRISLPASRKNQAKHFQCHQRKHAVRTSVGVDTSKENQNSNPPGKARCFARTELRTRCAFMESMVCCITST